jgi:prepilin-type N-terminal cleavage/methylation domain-containing protein
MKQLTTRGFTLIELLVVIAIIGLLASVVLTSLSSARSSAADARVKSQLASLRSSAEVYSGTLSAYTGVCDSDDTQALLSGLPDVACHDSVGNWAVEASLRPVPDGVGGFWCVDSIGSSRRIENSKGTATTCPDA